MFSLIRLEKIYFNFLKPSKYIFLQAWFVLYVSGNFYATPFVMPPSGKLKCRPERLSAVF